ncbi:hypothetical protein D3C80_1175170 [compost metagenome]
MQFFLTAGVIVTVIIYGFMSYFIACVAYGCYDKMRESYADYRYDLNWKSRAMSVVYAVGGLSTGGFVVWTGSILMQSIAKVM